MKKREMKLSWKEEAVRIYLTMPKKNDQNDWTQISQDLLMNYPHFADGCSSAARKVKNFITTTMESKQIMKNHPEWNIVNKQQNIQEDEISKEEQSKSTEKKKDAYQKTNTASSAHVNDEDTDEESESEVISGKTPIEERPIEMIYSKRNKDRSESNEFEIPLTLNEAEKFRKSENDILNLLGYDPELWKVVSSSCRRGVWDAQKKGGGVMQLHSYRINANVVMRSPFELNYNSFVSKFMDDTKNYSPLKYEKVEIDGENIAIITIADLHFGKLAWAPETGENYDYKIAKERFFHIINTAITRIKGWISLKNQIDKIIFFWSQDFFHYDTLTNTTTAGTQQDTDLRWKKLWDEGITALVEGIDRIWNTLKIPIMTFYTRSNHDEQTSYYALSYVQAWFRNNDNIETTTELDPSQRGRKYVEYGVNLFGFGHGDKEGKRIGQTMSIEAKEAWGRTEYHEFFLGHFHRLQVTDEGNCVIRYLASPTATDMWHKDSAFIGATKSAQVFIRNKYVGPTAEFPIVIVN